MQINTNLTKNIEYLSKTLNSDDVTFLDVKLSNTKAVLIFVNDLIDKNAVGELILRPASNFKGKINQKKLFDTFCSPEKTIINDMEKIVKIVFDSEFFCIFDTLECGQIFRYKQFNKGFLVFSLDKCAYCYADNKNTVIECLEEDQKYFDNFFDLQRDYKSIYNRAKEQKVKMLSNSAEYGKGIRILKQDSVEMLFSFIISQNNNIPRIKGIIEKLCVQLGEKKRFLNQEYFAFPKIDLLATQPLEFFQKIGLGYRANYIRQLAVEIKNGLDLNSFKSLSTLDLKKRLMQI